MEIWKPIDEFNGRYLISSIGNIKSAERLNYYGKLIPEKFLSPALDPHYYVAHLSFNGRSVMKKVHRLVAEAFIEKKIGREFVNHKNGIKTDNRVENLEWVTKSENSKHSYDKLGRKGAMTGKFGLLNPNSKKVHCDTLNISFVGCREAARILGLHATSVVRVCKGHQTQTSGLSFRYI